MVRTVPRVALVVPGSDERTIDEALARDVDEQVLDLQDAIAVGLTR